MRVSLDLQFTCLLAIAAVAFTQTSVAACQALPQSKKKVYRLLHNPAGLTTAGDGPLRICCFPLVKLLQLGHLDAIFLGTILATCML